jgi:hypothetical protein
LSDDKIGPNVKRLIIHKMSVDAIPAGGGLESGLRFLSSKESIMNGAKSATEWVKGAIEIVRLAEEPNPFKDADNETIAGELLRQIELRKSKV